MKKTIFSLLFIIVTPLFLFSQDFHHNSAMNDFINQRNIERFSEGKNNISGSPYENEEFKEGFIVSKTKQKYTNILLRFNIYNDVMDYKNEKGEVYSLDQPELFDFFMLGDKKYKYYPYSTNKKINKAYFHVMIEGKASLLKKEKIILKEATEPGAYKEAEPAKFVNASEKYYIQIGTREAQRISNKKDLIDILSSDVGSYIKKNKIKSSKEEDLIKLVEYYNQL